MRTGTPRPFTSLDEVVAFAIEILFCADNLEKMGKRLSKRRHGSRSLMASKVFVLLWRDMRDLYMSVCVSEGRTEAQCRDAGPLIVRNMMFRIMRRGIPRHVARALVAIAGGAPEESVRERMCLEVLSLLDSESGEDMGSAARA